MTRNKNGDRAQTHSLFLISSKLQYMILDQNRIFLNEQKFFLLELAKFFSKRVVCVKNGTFENTKFANFKGSKSDLKIPKTNTYLCHFCLQVNEVTKNFRLIRDCFSQYFSWMTRFQHVHQQNPDDPRLSDSLPKFRRAMFTVGLLVRHFDFSKQQLYEGLPVSLF